MGATVQTFHVRNDDKQRVASAAARAIRTRAYVSAPVNGWISIVDEHFKPTEPNDSESLGRRLAREHSAPILELIVFDSDVTYYNLFDRTGEVIARYDSNPAYFAPEAKSEPLINGDPALLARLTGIEFDPMELDAILWDCSFRFEDDRVKAIARLLGIPECRLLINFKDLTEPLERELTQFVSMTNKALPTKLTEWRNDMAQFSLIERTS